MKTTLTAILVILGALSVGMYYTYRTDKRFESYVNSLLQQTPNESADSVKVVDNSSQQLKPKSKKRKHTQNRTTEKIERDKYYKLDSFARNTPKQYEKDIETLVNYLITPTKSEIEKVRVLFTWVATHVHYDDEAYNSGNIKAASAEDVLLTRKAVCDGYSTLLYELCIEAGLEAEKVIGYAKGYSYEAGAKFKDTNHAWDVIMVENKWKLFDATWANGYGMDVNGKMVSVDYFEPYWFDVNPKEFINSHFPKESKWQLLSDTLSLEKFESLPYIPGTIF